MAFEGLTEKLNNVFKHLRGKGRLTESDIKEAMKEVRMALLEADVNYKVVKEFTNKVTEKAVGADVLESLSPAQTVVKIVNDELTAMMGGDTKKLDLSNPPAVIVFGGLQGAGKTMAPFLFSVVGMWGVRIVGTYICTQLLGLGLVSAWGCMIGHNMLLFVLYVIYFLRGRWNPIDGYSPAS